MTMPEPRAVKSLLAELTPMVHAIVLNVIKLCNIIRMPHLSQLN
jgi:hypothetical protein